MFGSVQARGKLVAIIVRKFHSAPNPTHYNAVLLLRNHIQFKGQHVEGDKFVHHNDVAALQLSAQGGCSLCAVLWTMVPKSIRIANTTLSNDPVQEKTPGKQKSLSESVLYTINELLRRDGRYTLNFFTHPNQVVSHRFEVVKIDDAEEASQAQAMYVPS